MSANRKSVADWVVGCGRTFAIGRPCLDNPPPGCLLYQPPASCNQRSGRFPAYNVDFIPRLM